MTIKKRLIINIYDDTDPKDAVDHVRAVMEQGRISNNNTTYCLGTTFKDGYVVYADHIPSSGTDTFRIWHQEK